MGKNNSVLVSVIIPVYNGEKYISQTIQSVLKQTYKPIEIIVVDDGSKDRTVKILKKFGSSIRWVSQPNKGVAGARNTALNMCKGRYVALIDADDLWLPDKISNQMKAFEKNPQAQLVWGGTVRSKTGWTNATNSCAYHNERMQYTKRDLLIFNKVAASTAVFKRKTAWEIGGFDEKVPPCDDWDMWIRLAQTGPIIYVNETVAIYRVHDEQISHNHYSSTNGELYVVKKHENLYRSFKKGHAFYRSELAKRLSVAAMETIKAGHPKQARSLALQSLFLFKKKWWPMCLKICLESIIGEKFYSSLMMVLKNKKTNEL